MPFDLEVECSKFHKFDLSWPHDDVIDLKLCWWPFLTKTDSFFCITRKKIGVGASLKAMRAKFQYFLKVGLWTWHPLTTHVCSFNFFSASRITSFWRKALIPGYCPFLGIVESWNFGHHYKSASCICSVQVWLYSYSHYSSSRYKNCRRKAYLVLFEPVGSSDSNGGI